MRERLHCSYGHAVDARITPAYAGKTAESMTYEIYT